jgi:hypothetical protein
MRTDPTDNGGLFIGRRPGTAPIRYRVLPEAGSMLRRRVDGLMAFGLLASMSFINLLFWGPIPLGWLWVGSQIDYQTGSVSLGIAVAFLGLLLMLMGALSVEKQLDHAWILVRRAAGHDQRSGTIGRVFAVTAVVGASVFTFWFLIIHGPGSSVISPQAS